MKAFLEVVELKVNDIITTSIDFPGFGDNDGLPWFPTYNSNNQVIDFNS